MKVKIAALLCLLAVMAALPAVAVRIGAGSSAGRTSTSATSDAATRDSPAPEKKTVCSAALPLCREDFCDGAIEAVLGCLTNNLRVSAGSVPGSANNNFDLELYRRIERIYDSSEEIRFTYQGNAVAIPYAACSNGATLGDENSPYLSPVASPWDCCCESYSADAACVGVSINGLNELCRRGYSAKQALRWYLPKLEIT